MWTVDVPIILWTTSSFLPNILNDFLWPDSQKGNYWIEEYECFYNLQITFLFRLPQVIHRGPDADFVSSGYHFFQKCFSYLTVLKYDFIYLIISLSFVLKFYNPMDCFFSCIYSFTLSGRIFYSHCLCLKLSHYLGNLSSAAHSFL